MRERRAALRNAGVKLTVIGVAMFLGAALPAALASAERWTATSSTAIAVTGDLEIAGDTLIFGNGLRLPLTPIGERQGR